MEKILDHQKRQQQVPLAVASADLQMAEAPSTQPWQPALHQVRGLLGSFHQAPRARTPALSLQGRSVSCCQLEPEADTLSPRTVLYAVQRGLTPEPRGSDGQTEPLGSLPHPDWPRLFSCRGNTSLTHSRSQCQDLDAYHRLVHNRKGTHLFNQSLQGPEAAGLRKARGASGMIRHRTDSCPTLLGQRVTAPVTG